MSSQEFFSEVLPLAIAGSCSPTTLVIGILILTSQNRPRAKAAAFTLGNLVVLAAVGAATLAFAHAAATATAAVTSVATSTANGATASPNPADASIDVFVGALLLVLTLRHLLRPKPPTEDAPPKWLAGIDRLGYGRSFLIGMGIMAINVSTLVVFLPAVRDVGRYAHDLPAELAWLALVVLIVESWMLAALAFAVLAPRRSARALRALNVWVGKHSRTICSVLFAAVGVYFVGKGLSALF